jgi:hypothetical protein
MWCPSRILRLYWLLAQAQPPRVSALKTMIQVFGYCLGGLSADFRDWNRRVDNESVEKLR